MYIYTYIYMYIYIYVYMYAEREIEADKERGPHLSTNGLVASLKLLHGVDVRPFS